MKVLATDLDGTLFYPKDKKNIICLENLKFIRDFIDEGNKVILISGRSFDFLKIVEQKINRPCSLICFNGALIYDEKIISSTTIPNEVSKNIVKLFTDYFDLPGTFIMTSKGVYIKLNTTKIFKNLAKIYYKSQKIYKENYCFDNLEFDKELNNGDIYKIMLFFGISRKRKEKASEANKVLRNLLKNYESSWSDEVIEITAKDCNKAKAILKLIDTENIKKDDVIVVGDSGNDISMFKEFYENSFCMGRANPIVKKYAKRTIDKFSDLSLYLLKK